jgi:cystathionine gamma-synthase
MPIPDTAAVTGGRGPRAGGGPLNVGVTFASNFHGGPYARDDGVDTWAALEQALGGLEGGRAVAYASGMAAVAAVLEQVPVGAGVVLPTASYTGTRRLAARWERAGRLSVRRVDIADTAAVTAACAGAALLWVESPTNPTLEVADLPAVVAAGHAAGARVAVDNTFATPLLQNPLAVGADFVVHSLTKFVAGHSDLLLGAVVAAAADDEAELREWRTLGGAVPGPMEAFLALRGLRTLPVRLRAGQAGAQLLAERLAGHPAVVLVRYPGLPTDPGHERARAQWRGFGAVLAVEVLGGAAAADAVCAAVRVVVSATSLGGVETTIERRQKIPGEEHVPAGLLRLSVGCEDPEDLWADLEQALAGG